MVSVIIPSRSEPYLQQAVADILSKARGEIEIIVVLDGYWIAEWQDDPRVTLIHRPRSGMRSSINAGARVAKGKYLMKCDAHCSFDEGFDLKLIADCKEDWVVVPRRYNLDVEKWEKGNQLHEFQYIERGTLKGRGWDVKVEGDICDLMTTQGSCYFMHRSYWKPLDEVNYGGMGREAQELSLRVWTTGGRMVLNRKTWYAHWDKPKEHVLKRRDESQKSVNYALSYWTEDKIKPVIDRFAPVPSWDSPTTIGSRIELYQMFAKRGYKVGCEVGVFDGRNAVNILNSIPNVKLYLVDPFCDYDGCRIVRGNRIKVARDRAHRAIGNRAIFIEKMSEDCFKEMPELDFVYIDGNHSYDFAMLDILMWSRRVRKGGIVSGHDYFDDPKRNCGVRSAVDDYVRQHGIKLNITEKIREPHTKNSVRSWWWVKE